MGFNDFNDCRNRFKDEKNIDYLEVPIEDESDETIKSYLERTCNFIGK
jgi:hypothetical protein